MLCECFQVAFQVNKIIVFSWYLKSIGGKRKNMDWSSVFYRAAVVNKAVDIFRR